MAGKRTEMLQAWLIWSALLIVFGFVGSAVNFEWIAIVPILGLLIHAGIIARRR